MPEIRLRICWPDGSSETCYSSSFEIRDFFIPRYPLYDFVGWSRRALHLERERVEERYRWPCSRPIAQLARIKSGATAFATLDGACVTVGAFEQ